MSHLQIIDHFEVNKKDKLGSGGFGFVYKATDLDDGQIVAAKEVFILDVNDAEEMERVQREVDLHAALPPHDNIVNFMGSKQDGDKLWIFTEYCNLGDLIKYCKENTISTEAMLDIMIQITKGIHHLHHSETPIAHRDIKPGNILFTKVDDNVRAKLCDLGISKATVKQNSVTMGFDSRIGTDDFMAPEQFELRISGKGTFNKSVDIFSAGLLFLVFVEAQGTGELVPIQSKILLHQVIMHIVFCIAIRKN